MPPIERKSLVLDIVKQQSGAADRIEILLNGANVASALQVGKQGNGPILTSLSCSIEAKVLRAGKNKRYVIEYGAEVGKPTPASSK